MSRPLRIQFPGALYHVTSRGNERKAIFADDHDRKRRLDWLSRAVATYGLNLHAFVLMDNHDHLFVETPQPNLAAAMHYYNSSYTGYFNGRYKRAGHLFQGRYHAVLIENEGHYLEVSRYIHLNPVRAGAVRHPHEWPWSSYLGYERGARIIPWVTYSRVLGEFGGHDRAARRAYCAFVAAGIEQPSASPLADALHGAVLGSERFVSRVRKLLVKRRDDSDLPVLRRLRERPSVEQIIRAVCAVTGADAGNWRRDCRKDNLSRALVAHIARRRHGYQANEIAMALGYSGHSSVNYASRRISESAPKIARIVEDIQFKLDN